MSRLYLPILTEKDAVVLTECKNPNSNISLIAFTVLLYSHIPLGILERWQTELAEALDVPYTDIDLAISAISRHIISDNNLDAFRDPDNTVKTTGNSVEHPDHYNWFGVECIDVISHFNYNIGAAIKHLWRHGRKGDALTDLRKAKQYIEFEIDRLSKEE